ncbi:MAG: hypothetical protein U9Q15_05255 [Patescibacteria group bacterium]|nr:hypothetical protein [Patescibacteria group bacterium]
MILGDNDNFTGAEEAATYMQKGVIKVLGNGTVYLFSTQPMEKNFFSGAQYIRPSMQIFRMDITRKDECKQSFQTFTGDKFFVENLMQYIDTLHISDS